LLDEFRIELQACERSSNRFRNWRIEVGRDLFGTWSSRVTFGRIGCDGHSLCRLFASEAEARRFMRQCLLRRRTATRRLGIAYRLVSASPEAVSLMDATGIRFDQVSPASLPPIAIPPPAFGHVAVCSF